MNVEEKKLESQSSPSLKSHGHCKSGLSDLFQRARHALGMLRFLYFDTTKRKLGYCGEHVTIVSPIDLSHPENVYLYDDTNIYAGATIISHTGRFIMKKHSGAAQGLTVVTGNHKSEPRKWFKDCMRVQYDKEVDIVVEEDVWIGSKVTLLVGAHLGRGCVVGSGTVVRSKVPPYSVVIGNPAKVVGFRFSPEEVLLHEQALYEEKERLPKELLEKNYNKYFFNRLKEINDFTKL